jgi:hypothetical protein
MVFHRFCALQISCFGWAEEFLGGAMEVDLVGVFPWCQIWVCVEPTGLLALFVGLRCGVF